MVKTKNLIIGFGKAGKTLAMALASKNEEVILVEKSSKMYGGTCINIGCIPSKTLIKGIEREKSFVDAMNYKNSLILKLREKNKNMLLNSDKITLIDGYARFKDNYTVEVIKNNGEIINIKSEYIYINTGSESRSLQIKGIDNTSPNIITSTQALDLKKPPKHLIIIGGGYIGLEMASLYKQAGSEVTVLDSGNTFMPREDEDISTEIFKDMVQSGIKFIFNANIVSGENKFNSFTLTNDVTLSYKINNSEEILKLTGDVLLLSLGRIPMTKKLGIENTNIILGKNGEIVVDEKLMTNVKNVFALGDVKGGLQFTYISLDDFRIIMNNRFGDKTRNIYDNNRQNIPYSLFIKPHYSRVGKNEKELIKENIKYRAKKIYVSEIPMAHILKETRGLFKVLIGENNDILGAALYGIESHELINHITLAMNNGITADKLSTALYTHPTMCEVFNNLFE